MRTVRLAGMREPLGSRGPPFEGRVEIDGAGLGGEEGNVALFITMLWQALVVALHAEGRK